MALTDPKPTFGGSNAGMDHGDLVQAPKSPYLLLWEKFEAGTYEFKESSMSTFYGPLQTLVYDAAYAVGERKINPAQDHTTMMSLEAIVSIFDGHFKQPAETTAPPVVSEAPVTPVV